MNNPASIVEGLKTAYTVERLKAAKVPVSRPAAYNLAFWNNERENEAV
jgi:hypothetical protein